MYSCFDDSIILALKISIQRLSVSHSLVHAQFVGSYK